MHKLDYFLRGIDIVNEKIGKVVCYAIALMMFITVFEVIMRYVFNSPTIWAWDVNKQVFSIIIFLGAGYTLMKKGHVAVDVIYSKWSDRNKAIADVITFPIFLIFTVILSYTLGVFAFQSIQDREVMSTVWAPPIYPLNTTLFIGTLLLLLQGLGKFLRDLRAILIFKKRNNNNFITPHQ